MHDNKQLVNGDYRFIHVFADLIFSYFIVISVIYLCKSEPLVSGLVVHHKDLYYFYSPAVQTRSFTAAPL